MKAFHDPKDDPTAKEQFIRARVTEEAEMGKEIERLKARCAELEQKLSRANAWSMDYMNDENEKLKLALAAVRSASVHASHAGHAPDIERVRRMHSRMTAENFAQMSCEEGHRIYRQSDYDACYLCTLLDEIERTEAERDAYLDLHIAQASYLEGDMRPVGEMTDSEKGTYIPMIRRAAGLGETATRVEAG